MANIKSQKKRIITNEKRRLRNNSIKSEIKTLSRKIHTAILNENSAHAQEIFKSFSKKIDKAVSKNILHTNNAANKKSKLAIRINNSKK